MPILYKCSWRGCSKIVDVQGYCKIHEAKIDNANKQRYKVYKTNRTIDEEQRKYQRFYNTKDWLRIRDSVISSCLGVDILEYYRTGKVIQGYTSHHIVELSDDYDMRLDIDNLIYLTESNHQAVHREYNKGDREKKAMQKILFTLKKKFVEEFEL